MSKARAAMLARVANAKKHDATTYHLQMWNDKEKRWHQLPERFYFQPEAVDYLAYMQDFFTTPLRVVKTTPVAMGQCEVAT